MCFLLVEGVECLGVVLCGIYYWGDFIMFDELVDLFVVVGLMMGSLCGIVWLLGKGLYLLDSLVFNYIVIVWCVGV